VASATLLGLDPQLERPSHPHTKTNVIGQTSGGDFHRWKSDRTSQTEDIQKKRLFFWFLGQVTQRLTQHKKTGIVI
jgi:hypothetical protein